MNTWPCDWAAYAYAYGTAVTTASASPVSRGSLHSPPEDVVSARVAAAGLTASIDRGSTAAPSTGHA